MSTVQIVITLAVTVIALWLIAVASIWWKKPSGSGALDAVRLLPDIVRLIGRLVRDPATPRPVRIALIGLGLWIASPIDLIPEFIPVIGPLDDIVVTAIVLRWVGRRIGADALKAHWQGSDDGFALLGRLLGW